SCRSAAHRALHSFPTRRSSDLVVAAPRVVVGLDEVPPDPAGDAAHGVPHAAVLSISSRSSSMRPAASASLMSLWPAGGRTVSTGDRKSTRLNSSHVKISYAVFC